MRNPAKLISIAVVCSLLTLAAAATAQQATQNRIVDGDFESGFLSLSLPAVSRFPMFSGGWASRGRRVPQVVEGTPFEGIRSLRVTTSIEDPVQVIQDLPINGPAFALRFAFMIEDGSQTIRLLNDWSRADPATGSISFAARLSAGGLSLTTPTGSWDLETEISSFEWHTLSVIADPRSSSQSVRLDGRQIFSLPGVASRNPTTLVLSGGSGDSGTFLYDAVELISLVDLELDAIRIATTELGGNLSLDVHDRLRAAGAALDRGAPTLALPELGVARNMIGNAGLAAENLRLMLDALIALLEADSAEGIFREQSQF